MLMSAYNEDICILVEELLGINLEQLRKKFSKLSLAVTGSIGIQLVSLNRNSILSGTDKQTRIYAPVWIHP